MYRACMAVGGRSGYPSHVVRAMPILQPLIARFSLSADFEYTPLSLTVYSDRQNGVIFHCRWLLTDRLMTNARTTDVACVLYVDAENPCIKMSTYCPGCNQSIVKGVQVCDYWDIQTAAFVSYKIACIITRFTASFSSRKHCPNLPTHFYAVILWP